MSLEEGDRKKRGTHARAEKTQNVRTLGQPADFVSKADYVSREFADLEAEFLWPRVWQVACREEEIPKVGDYITYDIVDESVIVVRSAVDKIKAYHNVCPHRGRRLVNGEGRRPNFTCGFHGWRWDLHGQNTHIVDEHDWGGCIHRDDVKLQDVRVEIWGGFVFINMDPDAEPLDAYLGEVKTRCERYEFDKLRFYWYKSTIFPCNWKVFLEAFNEAYHVQTAHPQFLQFLEDYTNSTSYGKHSAFFYPPLPDNKSRFGPSSRLNREGSTDYRTYLLQYLDEMHDELGAMVTTRARNAAQRLMTEVPPETPSRMVYAKYIQFQREAAEADGAGWPAGLDLEYMMNSHSDWHVFPNFIFLHSNIDGAIFYRGRPNGRDPDSCIIDVWSLVRYAPGAEPALKREFYPDWTKQNWGRILNQDFDNLPHVQRGMKSRAFRGSITNPVQERAVSNMHRVLHEFIEKGKQQKSRLG